MELNNKLITNRSSFIENFSINEAFEFGKISAICSFFEETICILSDKEKKLINYLKNPEQIDLFSKYQFEYAKDKAEEWQEIYSELNEEEKNKIKQTLILLELAENDGKNVTIDMLVSNVEKNAALPIERTDDLDVQNKNSLESGNIIDVTKHIGTIILKKYNFKETVSEENKIITKTFVNKSTDPNNISTIEVFDEGSGQRYYVKLGSGETIKGSFIKDKLVALFPCIELGEDHIVVRNGMGRYKYLNVNKKEEFVYNIPGNDITYFSATNDGAVFIIGNNIKLYSDVQITIECSFKYDEKPIMVCVKENRYVILTDYGRLLTNTGENIVNICYVIMRETGDWYAISAEGVIYCNGKEIQGTMQVITNFEAINLCGKNHTKLEEEIVKESVHYKMGEDEILDDAVFWGKTSNYTAVETTKEFILYNKNLEVIRYDK